MLANFLDQSWHAARIKWLCGGASVAALCVATLGIAQDSLQIVKRLELTGRVESVTKGRIRVVDSKGRPFSFQIAERGEETVPLEQAGMLLRMPADVEVTGEFDQAALSPGKLVQLQASINTAGQSRDKISSVMLWEDSQTDTGVTPDPPAEKEGSNAFTPCQIKGTVYRLIGGKMIVTVGKNDQTRHERLSFNLDDAVTVRMQSKDYERAAPGDRVTSLQGFELSSGDFVVTKLRVEKQVVGQRGDDAEDALQAKYRHLADEPGIIRDERSRHFLLHTDVSERSAHILLDKLETMISLVSAYYQQRPTQIIECYVVHNLESWPAEAFDVVARQKIAEPAGVTQSRSLGRQTKAIVYSCDDHKTVQHEAVHAYCAQTFGSTGPTWYSEGMAEMGSYWIPGERSVQIPAVAIHYLRNTPPRKLSTLLAPGNVTGDSWFEYQWRWALCHLLANNPNYSPKFKSLGINMMRETPGASFQAAYGDVSREIAFEYQFLVQHVENGFRADLCAWEWNKASKPVSRRRARAVRIDAQRGWQGTGGEVEQGQKYTWTTSGRWKTSTDRPACTAEGDSVGRGRLSAVVFHNYSLSDPFDLGESGTFTAPQSGHLLLRCHDSWNELADNSGKLSVQLKKVAE